MATRADMEKELAELRARMKDLEEEAGETASAASAAMDAAGDAAGAAAERVTGAARDAADVLRGAAEDPRAQIEQLLADHGLGRDEVGNLVDDLAEELRAMPARNPLLTALAAFALGVAVGRMTRS